MRVRSLERNERLYSSNVLFLLGDWSKIDDVNTLIDVGADPAVIPFVEGAPTGVGKRKIDLVLLTHRHYDHTVMLPSIREKYRPTVAAWGPTGDGVDVALADGQRLRVADDWLEVIHTPAHTDDSVCYYAESSHALFVGDTPVLVRSDDHTYLPAFVDAIARIASKPVETIYFGHGEPLAERCQDRLRESLENLRRGLGRADR